MFSHGQFDTAFSGFTLIQNSFMSDSRDKQPMTSTKKSIKKVLWNQRLY